jgi:hypothetical protein
LSKCKGKNKLVVEGKLDTALSGLIITGNFWCDGLELNSLEGCPKEIHGSFSCTNNPNLKDLSGKPEVIKGNFWH